MAKGRSDGDGVLPEDLKADQQASLIKRYTLTLRNGDKLVPSRSDVLKILEENYKVSQSHKMTFKSSEVPFTDRSKMNILKGYDPNKMYEDDAMIRDEVGSRRAAYNRSQSGKSLTEAWNWGKSLSKKYPKRKNPSSRHSFHNAVSDVDWLFNVHLKHLKSRYRENTKSFALYGNEDAPDKVELYRSKHPKYSDGKVTITQFD